MHCRVGTSRSAAIAIVHVQQFLDISFSDAYFWVRARRTGVIIQPNLLFVWEMLASEARKRGAAEIGWTELCQGIAYLNGPGRKTA